MRFKTANGVITSYLKSQLIILLRQKRTFLNLRTIKMLQSTIVNVIYNRLVHPLNLMIITKFIA